MLSFAERYEFYTNKIFDNNESYIFVVSKSYLTHQQNKPLYIDEFNNANKNIIKKLKHPYLIVDDDGFENYNLPCFQKVRTIINHCNFSILNKMHFGH